MVRTLAYRGRSLEKQCRHSKYSALLPISRSGGIAYTAHGGAKIRRRKKRELKSKWGGGSICAPRAKHGIVPQEAELAAALKDCSQQVTLTPPKMLIFYNRFE